MIDRDPPSTEEDAPPDMQDRLIAAFIAPIFFNLSMLIVIAVLFRRRHFWDFWFSHWPTATVLLMTLVLPVAAGFIAGTGRFTTLLGHLFYTHQEHEQDLLKTLAAWAALIGLAWLLS